MNTLLLIALICQAPTLNTSTKQFEATDKHGKRWSAPNADWLQGYIAGRNELLGEPFKPQPLAPLPKVKPSASTRSYRDAG